MTRRTPFRLRNTPLLSRVGADRADVLRTDVEAATAGWRDALLLRVDRRNQVLIADGQVVLNKATEIGDKPPEDAVFLGRLGDGRHVWAVRAALEPPADRPDATVLDLRRTGHIFDDVSAQLVATATALLNWHDNAKFSAIDGAPTKPVNGGWSRVNLVNGHEEFPRIDPAVICLVHDDVGVNGERVLLARGAGWPEGSRSVLAGFVEAGESLEACVVREIREEVGVTVRDVRYLGSQPWPFPRSIMLGFAARADRDAPLTLAEGEIEAARWFTREEVRAAFARAYEPRANGDGGLRLPGNSSIARLMLEAWAAAEP